MKRTSLISLLLFAVTSLFSQSSEYSEFTGQYLGQKKSAIPEERSPPVPVPTERNSYQSNTDSQKEGDERLKGLDTLITKILHEWNIPGCAVAVVEKQEVLFAGGFGYRELRSKKPVDEHTIFPIASCTKAFTAALIGILAEEGKLDINKPANNYLPFLKFSDQLLTLQVTPRDMMTHQTGIPRHDNAIHGFRDSPRDSLVRLIQYFSPSAGLRQAFIYNNFMYVALGAMVEHIERGKTWEEQIEERFFKPIGMSSSSVYAGYEKNKNVAFPHEVGFTMQPIEVPFPQSQNMAPCGSISSNAEDMAKWLITLINGGKYNNKVIIPKRYLHQAIATQWGSPSGPSNTIQYLGYGFGWNIALYRNHYSVFHGGSGDGYSSMVLFLPSDSLGIVILANKRADDAMMTIANSLYDKFLLSTYTDWSTGQLIAYKNRLKGLENQFFRKGPSKNPPTHEMNAYCGDYTNPGYGRISIFQRGDSLCGSYGNMNVWFRHTEYDAFTAFIYRWEHLFGKIDVNNRPAVFRQDSKGEISELTILLERAVDPTVFKKEKPGTPANNN